MTDERKQDTDSDRQTPTPHRDDPGQIDRRSFFRGAAVLAVGGLSAPAALAQIAARARPPREPPRRERATRSPDRPRTALGRARPRQLGAGTAGVDHNVVIVGGGQSGSRLAYGLRRKGIGGVEVIDRAEPGQAGIWRNDRADAPAAHAENHAGTRGRQRRAELPRLVRNLERPRGVRRSRIEFRVSFGPTI